MELLAIDFSAVLTALSLGVAGVVAVRVVDSFAKRRVQDRTRDVLKAWRQRVE
jgi:hypothetical protein